MGLEGGTMQTLGWVVAVVLGVGGFLCLMNRMEAKEQEERRLLGTLDRVTVVSKDIVPLDGTMEPDGIFSRYYVPTGECYYTLTIEGRVEGKSCRAVVEVSKEQYDEAEEWMPFVNPLFVGPVVLATL